MNKNRIVIMLVALLFVLFDTKAQVKVACIGDSVTEGLGLEHPESESYPSQLQELLGAKYEVGNFGHSGATLLRKGHRPYCKQQKFADALNFVADIAVIHLGLNDTDPRTFPHYRDEFVLDYVWLIDTLLQTNPEMDIYICSMTPIFTGHSRFTSSTYEWHQLLQKEIEVVCDARDVHFIDLFEALRYRPDLITDAPTLHPNKGGAQVIAKTVCHHITGEYGGLSLSPAWSSNMVLQKESEACLSGLANAGSFVQVSWRGERYSTEVGKNGHWEIVVPTGSASTNPLALKITSDAQEIILDNILVGQVWLAMGQSNMAWRLDQVKGGESKAQANNQNLRLFRLAPVAETDNRAWSEEVLRAANELDFFHGSWQESSPREALAFSAIGFSFGDELQKELEEPVGIIQLAVGGAPLISWVSRGTLLENPRFHGAFVRWRQKDYVMGWCRERANTNLELAESHFQRHPYEPSFIHEAGLRQLCGVPVSGVLWYQGESDAENAELHQHLFPLFAKDLREQFGVETPILTVQLSSINRPSWPRFRDAQRHLAQEIPNVHLAISHDYGNPTDVHPTDKLPVAHRLVKLALREHYGRTHLIASCPMPIRVAKDGEGVVTIFFDEMESTLSTIDDAPVRGLVGISIDGEKVPLEAWVCKGCKKHIHFKLPDTKLRAVAYAWDPYVTRCNVILKGGQPLPTFVMTIQ